jgi:hypothetical protein
MSRVQGDVFFNGTLSAKAMTLSAGCVDNNAVKGAAAIDATKVQHQHRIPYSQANVTAVTETRVIYRCYGATGTIVEFAAGSIAIAAGAATVTFDLQKSTGGGAFATVLTAVVTLNASSVARVAQLATILTNTLVAGDVLQLVVTATASGGTIPTGIFSMLTVNENPL